jgi:hypothetical protein
MPSGSHEDEASGSTESDGRLRAFRERLHASCGRRADALFELTDAVLTSGPVHSLLHLSLAVAHRRGWCSLYATLSKGRVDPEALTGVLPRHLPDGSATPVYAVDVSP